MLYVATLKGHLCKNFVFSLLFANNLCGNSQIKHEIIFGHSNPQ
jgi:hypothetical protein